MSGELLSLIGQATGRRVRWRDVVVMNNVAAIPPINDIPGDYVWNRGFNVVVLDAVGSPKFFCKCRSLHDDRLAHETTSMLALHDVPGLQEYVPPVQHARSTRLRVLVTTFLDGKPLNDLLDDQFNRKLAKVVTQALDGVVELSLQATQVLSHLMPDSRTIDLSTEADNLIKYLESVGLTHTDAATLKAVLQEVGEVPRQLQHGDLWPANLIRSRGKLQFLDFEMFGRVQVPMYDVFHFLRTCGDVWVRDGEPVWLDQMNRGGASSIFMQSEIGRVAHKLGVTPAQSVAALIYYVVHFAVTTHRRNPDGHVWKLFVQEARMLGDHVRRGNVHRLLGATGVGRHA